MYGGGNTFEPIEGTNQIKENPKDLRAFEDRIERGEKNRTNRLDAGIVQKTACAHD